MAESQKGAVSNCDSKRKSSLLDEEFGKEFLSSWKTMSVTKDDGMDFSCETTSKGMKKNFNFDKLDMDFALDGDFGKISSFKVDMSDLDFSSPKSGERPDKKSIDGKHEAKKDHFNFNFDFKELDSFDLDSSLMKGKQKSEKCTDDKEFDSSVRHEKDQGSRSNLATEADAFKEDDAKKASVTASKFESLIDGLGESDSVTGGAPTSSKFENVNASGGATASQDENMNNRREETNEPSQHSTISYDQQPLQDSSGQSISFDDPRQETAADLQAGFCFSETAIDTNPGLQSTKCEIGKRLVNQSQVHMGNTSGDESAPGNAGFQSTTNEFQKKLVNQNHITMRNISGNKSALGNADIVDASTTSLSPEMQNTKARKENNVSVSQLLLAPVQSEPRAVKVTQMKEQGNGGTHSTFRSRTQENVSQSHPALAPMKSTVAQSPSLSSKTYFSCSLSKVHDASLTEGATKSKPLNSNPKVLIPSMNSKSISVERNGLSTLKVGNKTSDATSLKISRIVTSKNDLSVSTLKKEFKSLRNSEGSMEIHLDLARMMNQSISSEKQKLPTPSLKRKTFEEPSADTVMLYPLKRMTEPPNHSRKAREVFQQVDESLVHDRENLVDGWNKDILFDHPTHKLYTSQQVPIVMENDENVEKAEAYIKELEDICNMLKKKHEEAKEVLVRALVNNNNLLMLNHPIHEQKISKIQKFAAFTRSKELQF